MRRAGTLLAGLLLASACGSGGGSRDVADNGTTDATGPPGAQTARLLMEDNRFRPSTVRAAAGTLTLRLDNAGRLPHDLAFDQAHLGRTATIDGGGSASLTVVLGRPGTYTFVCTFHPGMTGQVIVS